MVKTINEKIEESNNIQFKTKPIEKIEFLYSDKTKDEYKLRELINFLQWHKDLIKFVNWITNTVYLKTNVNQPIYLTDSENYAKTLDDRLGFYLTE